MTPVRAVNALDLEIACDLEAEGAASLKAEGIENPRREARLFLRHATGLSSEDLIAHPRQSIPKAASAVYREFIRRRMKHEPAAYITGKREFWSLDFRVSPAVLVPRPESETLIEAALAQIADRNAPLRVGDFGTGTGCLLMALLSELPSARGVGLDVSAAAIAVAQENAAALELAGRVRFAVGDWGGLGQESFDIALANPPYICDEQITSLAPEIRDHEPRLALSGGDDGLVCYRSLVRALARTLSADGFACVELGAGQAECVTALAAEAGLRVVEQRRDLAGILRCLVFVKTGQKNLLE